MQLRADALPAHLARCKLVPVYVVSGDEPLLAIEAQDSIRAAARAAGYSERDVLTVDARWDWSQLSGASQGMSLFAERKILEIRLPSGKPGKDGGEALKAHAAHASEDVLTLIALPKLDRAVRDSGWATALDGAGVWVDVPKIERAELPAWIGQRLKRQNQSATREALEFIADRVEGNLLAAHQEIGKLGLLHPPGELTLEHVTDSVLDVARFDVWALPQAMLTGDHARLLRTLDGLRAEGEALPLVLWAVTEEIRALLRVKSAMDNGRAFAQAVRDARVWGPRQDLMQRMIQRVDTEHLGRLLARCADVDRLFKGLRPRGADSDPWLELEEIAVAVSGRWQPVPD
ncbi:MAG: DNA polymerase III subunit delta [Burkholderiales bacterium]|nr:DNA polymerase III subunit delta [Burkholderiales bacterium]